jgi:hypothetical protein
MLADSILGRVALEGIPAALAVGRFGRPGLARG